MTEHQKKIVRLAIEYLEHPDVAAMEFAVRSEHVARGLRRLLSGDDFVPTHTIVVNDEPIPVHLDADELGNGPAYTQEEWNAQVAADWECTDDGWLFQGRSHPTAGIVEIKVDPVPLRATALVVGDMPNGQHLRVKLLDGEHAGTEWAMFREHYCEGQFRVEYQPGDQFVAPAANDHPGTDNKSVWCRLDGWEVQMWRSSEDGKMVVQIDTPDDDELTDTGEPDGRIWLNECLLHPEHE